MYRFVLMSILLAGCSTNLGSRDDGSSSTAAKATPPLTQPLTLSVQSNNILTGQSDQFTALGGNPPYIYSVQAGSGIIDSSFGLFQPGSAGTTTVIVHDKNGATATASVAIAAPPVVYSWHQSGWSACSASCGGGTQSQTVTCEEANGIIVDNSLCAGAAPPSNQTCNNQGCPAHWTLNEQDGCDIYQNGQAYTIYFPNSGDVYVVPGECSGESGFSANGECTTVGIHCGDVPKPTLGYNPSCAIYTCQ